MQKIQHHTTSHIRVDLRFAGLLSEDFGLDESAILKALAGEPQRAAIAVAEWAAGTDDPAKALTNYARKHKTGAFKKSRRNMTPAEQRAALDRRVA